jgi:short-subunit dehydrogenase
MTSSPRRILGADQGPVRTNFFGVVRMARAMLPSMRAHDGGSVNIGSLAGLIGVPFEGF